MWVYFGQLLVVIAIIGILVSLLLPAVQAARESARRVQCSNHLKQLGLAANQHVSVQNQLPTGGWGWRWLGAPARGMSHRQPGGWVYNLLPFIEQMAVYNLQLNKTGSAREQAAAQMMQTPLDAFNCPSRRTAKLFTWNNGGPPSLSTNIACASVARSDYVANAGPDVYDGTSGFGSGLPYNGPDSLAAADAATNDFNKIAAGCKGVVFAGSEITPAAVSDGMSQTFLFGEKYLTPDCYETGTDAGDNESMYIGDNQDISRWVGNEGSNGSFAPAQDQAGYSNGINWGSAHAGTFQMVFCDGSVHALAYAIDLTVFARLGNRRDGKVVDGSQF